MSFSLLCLTFRLQHCVSKNLMLSSSSFHLIYVEFTRFTLINIPTLNEVLADIIDVFDMLTCSCYIRYLR